jgi:transcriptional regulator with XRE-family HTH domain
LIDIPIIMQAQTKQRWYFTSMPSGRIATKTAPKFGQRMAAFRVAKGLSQTQLAKELDMTRDRIAYFERVSHNPNFEVMQKMADFFGVSLSEMLNDLSRNMRKPGPASVIEQLAARAAKLPRSEQKVVIKMLEGVLQQAS